MLNLLKSYAAIILIYELIKYNKFYFSVTNFLSTNYIQLWKNFKMNWKWNNMEKLLYVLQYHQNNSSEWQHKCCEFAVKRRHHQSFNYNTLYAVQLYYVLVMNFHSSIVKLQQKFFIMLDIILGCSIYGQIQWISRTKNQNFLYSSAITKVRIEGL